MTMDVHDAMEQAHQDELTPDGRAAVLAEVRAFRADPPRVGDRPPVIAFLERVWAAGGPPALAEMATLLRESMLAAVTAAGRGATHSPQWIWTRDEILLGTAGGLVHLAGEGGDIIAETWEGEADVLAVRATGGEGGG